MSTYDTETIYRAAPPRPSRAKRKIPRKARDHFVGQIVLGTGTNQQTVGFASLLEYKAAICAAYRPGFIDLEEQLDGIRIELPSGRRKTHYLDYRVTHTHSSGRGKIRTGMAVKTAKRAACRTFAAEMKALRAAAVPAVIDRLCVVTERQISPFVLANAELFHACRHPDPALDVAVASALRDIEEPTVLHTALERHGLGGIGYHSAVRLIRTGGLRVAPKMIITPWSMIIGGNV